MPDNVLIASDITVELGSAYVGSAYSPQASVTQTDTGWELTITYADPDTPGELATLTIPVDSAGFGEVTANVESGHGTPSVTVTESGPDTAKSFHFAFSGIGGFSPTITVTEIEGGHRVTVTDVDGTESFDVLDGDASQAIEDAERAAAAANAAAATADASAAAADTATAAAQAATTAAQTATTAAQAATTGATTAAQTATTAAQVASEKADLADAAADAATDAAARADTAAESALSLALNVPVGSIAEGTTLVATDTAKAPLLGANVFGNTEDGSSISGLALAVAPEGFNLMLGTSESKSVTVGTSGNAYTGTYHTAGWLDLFSDQMVAGQTVMTISFDWEFDGTPDADTYHYAQFHGIAPINSYIIASCAQDTTYPVRQYITESSGHYWCTFYVNLSQITSTSQNNRVRVYGPQGAKLTISNFKLEFGTETPWVGAPEEVGQAIAIDLDGHVLASSQDARDELQVSRDGSVKLIQRVGAQATYDLPSITMPMQGNPVTYAWVQSSPTTTLAVTYERDIDLALAAARDEALAAIADPDDPVASSNHAVGTYLTMGGKLYRVTTAIAVGESITPGTNVTATTVMAEVLSIVQ